MSRIYKYVPMTMYPSFGRPGGDPSPPGSNFPNMVLNDNPVAYYRHEAGALEIDSSGNGNDATTTTDVTETAGLISGAGSYNGSTSLQSVPNASSIENLLFAHNNLITVEMLMYTDGFAHTQVLVCKTDFVSGNGGWAVFLDTSGFINFHDYDYGSPPGQFRSTAAITDTAWHHIVVTAPTAYQSTDLGVDANIYVDGVAVATTHVANAGGSPVGDTFHPLILGYYDAGVLGSYFDGLFDEVAVYDYVLTSTQVAGHASSAGF